MQIEQASGSKYVSPYLVAGQHVKHAQAVDLRHAVQVALGNDAVVLLPRAPLELYSINDLV